MSDFLLFLGRFHVLALHLPIGMVILTVIVHWLARDYRNNSLQQVLPLLWACTAFSALITVILGLLHFGEGGFSGSSASAHRLWGIGFAIGTQLAWFLCVFNVTFYWRWGGWLTLVLLAAVTMTGHYGGNLTHGSTYLVEYAPEPVRDLVGAEERRAPATELSRADPWHDIVSPMLQSRCSNCHNADKQNGQLDLSSLDSILVGGESGAVVLPGNAAGSDLYKRVTLPENHENFMPAEGKTPLTVDQVAILGWWIDAGLPSETSLSAVPVDAITTSLLAAELDLAPAPIIALEGSYAPVTQGLVEQMVASGWLVRKVFQESSGLVVSINAIGQPVSREMLVLLAEASGSVVELNLASTGMNDELLAMISDMPVLESLNLSNNGITDEGLALVSGFSNLETINLYGNPAITDAGLADLRGLESLASVYLWGTAVTDAGIASLQSSLDGINVQGQALPR